MCVLDDVRSIPDEVDYTMMVNVSTGEFDVTPHLQRAVDTAIMQAYVRTHRHAHSLLGHSLSCVCGLHRIVHRSFGGRFFSFPFLFLLRLSKLVTQAACPVSAPRTAGTPK